jgi:uncharacterized lipoprotein YddW (UPF0748 family)
MTREFRAAWVATVDNIDWPSSRTLSTSAQQTEMIRLLDVAKAMNLNAILLQVRPSADALYASPLEPWSEYLTGRQGRSPSPYYDPLEFAVKAAHERGLELHCWFNPYRALSPAQRGPLASRHIARSNPRIVKRYGSFLWMDPGEPEVQRRSLEVILDVVRRYDIDGVHIDDYFYPYKEKGPEGQIMDFPDDLSFGRYRAEGGTLTRDDWRRKNVDDFIERLYAGIKQEKKWVKFGISPFGIWRPGNPSGIKAGVDQYADLYADPRKWLREGWCDYMTPQLYWPIRQTAQSYPALLHWWMEQNVAGRHLWPGNFTSRLDPSSHSAWPVAEIKDQIDVTRHETDGNVHFSMKAFLDNWRGVRDALRDGPYHDPALVPASPWLGDGPPRAPRVDVNPDGGDGGAWHAKWSTRGRDPARFYEVQTFANGRWQPPTVGSATESDVPAAATRLAVTAIDRAGNESPPTIVTLH